MKFILGKKMPMTQIWDNDQVIAVTPVLAGPCVITQIKTKQTDNYSALQLAYGNRKAKNLKKPQRAKYEKLGLAPMHVREFRLENDMDVKAGDLITVESFTAGDLVQVSGTSKGRGFQGVVKRHGFQGGRKSHGNKDQLRMPGSIGAKGPAHVFKGMRMAGRMGNERVSIQNLKVVSVDLENNIIYIQGAVPGSIDALLEIKGRGELVIKAAKSEKEAVATEQSVAEDIKEENKEVEEIKTEAVKEEVKTEEKAEEKKENTEDLKQD